MYRYPAYGNTGHDFEQKQSNDDFAVDTQIFYYRHTQKQPAKQNQVNRKQQVIQNVFFTVGR
jgi:hypothetical protein